ncbi:MAG: MBL fold metallo-hydrolase [Bacteroidales bacterium]|nr:MBL fold metallo-hydrolase [Bacteroidales bacterium]
MTDKLHQLAQSLEWLCNAGFRLQHHGMTIYIDPWQLRTPDTAHLVLITHGHFDHFDPESLRLRVGPQTTIACTADVAHKALELGAERVLTIAPGGRLTVADVLVEAVPMYNTQKPQFHPKANGWVGYVLTLDGLRLYHAGDTERTPDMAHTHCDLALLPLGQTYTMCSVEEAAQAAIDTKAKIVIPMHFDVHESQPGDPERLSQLLHGHAEVLIKQPSIATARTQ